ncbi:BolA/IbaG family iron-sulfur metabolism protein [Pseudobacteriovorax antillogorgiicola]|uniref:Transcriptional regulator, BolA protein family n=1 Tax=Pseudobacteriovorax antillogorgiicola TaxID=1513793 RepID=A0A1Y6CCI0_9BACT|nr:BolA family protein [Pseudobacteriovorax antillogorgiicola]TCS48690.1 BolA protein family transcriptional regulator [Pseudobacteriovorax antillogorgiicola]SMF54791.1 transcriptional regulator, BolA protein family [Pseudobacteriovorax antillogorgiicola]
MTAEDIVARIQEQLPGAVVKAQDLTGGGDHWRLEVVATEFSGLNMVEQHQLVYKALGEWMSGPIHALSLDTKAP